MLPKRQRMSLKQKLNPLTTLSCPFFVIKLQKNDLGYNRYGFIISKKIDTRAVMRNKIKRLFAEVLVKTPPSLVGYDMLFIVKGLVKEVSKEKLNEEIRQMLSPKKSIL